jgi:hypothetical protein
MLLRFDPLREVDRLAQLLAQPGAAARTTTMLRARAGSRSRAATTGVHVAAQEVRDDGVHYIERAVEQSAGR